MSPVEELYGGLPGSSSAQSSATHCHLRRLPSEAERALGEGNKAIIFLEQFGRGVELEWGKLG
jgi:hypothetical protein